MGKIYRINSLEFVLVLEDRLIHMDRAGLIRVLLSQGLDEQEVLDTVNALETGAAQSVSGLGETLPA